MPARADYLNDRDGQCRTAPVTPAIARPALLLLNRQRVPSTSCSSAHRPAPAIHRAGRIAGAP